MSVPRMNLMEIRDRSKIEKPLRCRANGAILKYEPSTYKQAFKCPAASNWKLSMEEEMKSHKENVT